MHFYYIDLSTKYGVLSSKKTRDTTTLKGLSFKWDGKWNTNKTKRISSYYSIRQEGKEIQTRKKIFLLSLQVPKKHIFVSLWLYLNKTRTHIHKFKIF